MAILFLDKKNAIIKIKQSTKKHWAWGEQFGQEYNHIIKQKFSRLNKSHKQKTKQRRKMEE